MSDLLNKGERDFLLRLARETITAYLRGDRAPIPPGGDAIMREKRGAFVTLHVDGQLRGCIGYPLPYKPLAETVAEMAVAAASQDYRFEPLAEKELGRLRIEISVLTLPRPVKDVADIEVGKHGIIVSKGPRTGLLLPQVPTEQGWNRETYLRHGCLKAGLPDDEWKKGAKFEVFEAQVFSEPEETK